jgi:nucleotide-binding universal stress UspA family protein
MHLARRVGATLHVMPTPLSRQPSGSTVEQNDLHARVARLVPNESEGFPLHIIEDPPRSTSGILQYVADANVDLVVTDTPPDQGPVPPLAADVFRVLTEQLACPVFVVEHVADPTAIRDILVPTDLSDHALRAFRHALALARVYDAAVRVLHVVESLPYVALTPTDRLSLGTTPLSVHRGRRRLRGFLEEGGAEDVPVQTHLAYGDVADRVVQFANRDDVDLTVLSSHGNGDQSEVPLGQVAERVLGQVTCPLFLLRAFGPSLLARPAGSTSGTTPP